MYLVRNNFALPIYSLDNPQGKGGLILELELFYKIVESEIRRRHVRYLKRKKGFATAADVPDSSPTPAEPKEPVDSAEDYLQCPDIKSFNKGIELALKILKQEFKAFEKRKETVKDKKFKL